MVYKFLISEEIREHDDDDPTKMGDERRLIPLSCELENPLITGLRPGGELDSRASAQY